MEADAETGLEHTTWRKYDSWQGRWTSPDPYPGSMSLGDPQSFNRYAYVLNDPVNLIDPTGLEVCGGAPGNNCNVVGSSPGGSGGIGGIGGLLGVTLYEELIGIGEVGGGSSVEPPTAEPNVNDLRNRIANFLKKPGCADFIKDLITRTGTDKNPTAGTDAMKLFNEIISSSQKGVVYGNTIKEYYGYEGATVHGSIGAHTAQIELPIPRGIPTGLSRRGRMEYMNDQARISAQAALHETVHLAGRNGAYSDLALANSVAAMRGVTAPKFGSVRAASEYWNAALAKACY